MSTMPIELKDIIPGLSLGDYKVTPSKTQLFMFSALTWNRHQIHFNRDQAELEGFPDVAVQRGLIGNFLAQFVTNWIADYGFLKNLQWKVLQSAFPDQELKCVGEVSLISNDREKNEINCALRVLNAAGTPIAIGEAILLLKNGELD